MASKDEKSKVNLRSIMLEFNPPINVTPPVPIDARSRINRPGLESQAKFRSKSNHEEALAVRRVYCVLNKMGAPPGTVAVLTPYSGQRSHLTTMLQKEIDESLIVATFEEYQLRRDIVLDSLVRSNNTYEVCIYKTLRWFYGLQAKG
ncbi:hypothetical protein TWF730_006748 [Orbilia blumenaviensis]|uniref:DNA2/NAM7 helicase-like C-terminal domain-containing protein n=1 Tax=Orbilia blumenaviensis TaxID=1796055 RepID=A0AAV9VF61_9PEZI